MYPIERTDYINAYIGAISEEIQQTRIDRQTSSERSRPLDHFSSAVARLLRTGSKENRITSRPQPTNRTELGGTC